MNMYYKIISIQHNGKSGKRGRERSDGRYPYRIGRVVDFEPRYLKKGIPLVLPYVYDSDGSYCRGKYTKCSNISDVWMDGKDTLLIETSTSIYVLQKTPEQQDSPQS